MNKNTGFTLVELMIVVAIIGILAAIAYPSYQGALRDSRRAVAGGDLVRLAAGLERYYTANSKYSGATLAFTESPQDGTTKYYNLIPTTINDVSFSISAVPKNAQAADYCGTLTYNDKGTKGGLVAGCW